MIRMIVNNRHNQCEMPTVHGHKCCSVLDGCGRFGESNTYLMDVGSFHGRCFGFSNPSSTDDPISSVASAAPIGAHDREGRLRYRLKAKAEAGRGVTGKRTIKKGRATRSHSPNGRTKIPSDTDRGAIE